MDRDLLYPLGYLGVGGIIRMLLTITKEKKRTHQTKTRPNSLVNSTIQKRSNNEQEEFRDREAQEGRADLVENGNGGVWLPRFRPNLDHKPLKREKI